MDDLKNEILAIDRKLAEKVYIVKNHTSAVTVPDGAGGYIVDFTPQMEEAFVGDLGKVKFQHLQALEDF